VDHILESLGRIADLSDDELQDLKDSIITEFKAVESQENSREVVDTINQLADAADAIKNERERRDSEAAELSAAREAATARVTGLEDAAADAPVEDDEDDIDPVTGKKKKKAEDAEDAAPPVFSSVDTIAEPEADTNIDSPAEAELAVEQPAVQPAEITVVPENAKGDAELTDQVEGDKAHAVVDNDEVIESFDAESSDVKDEEPADAVSEDNTTKEEDPEETVTAAGNAPELSAPADRQLKVEPSAAPVTITAGANIPDFAAGSELNGLKDVAKAMFNRQHKLGMSNPSADGEYITVATFSTSYPEERTLSSADKDSNSDKVAAVIAPQALVAAGGLCAPVDVSYDIFGFGVLDRPVRDSLAKFAADRGGIRFVTPPTLSDLTGAVSLWTLQDDIDAATAGAPDPVKPCIRVNCGQEVVVYTDAIPLCLTFGNLNSRAWPELIERHTELGLISHARYAETRLLTRIGALSTAVSATALLGAARDYFVQLEQIAAGYRSRHRLDPKAKLRVLLPEWFRNALRADLTRQLPGDGQDVTFNLTDAQIDSFFRARNVEPSFFLDGETGQIFGTQAAGAISPFPANVIWYLFAEGTFLFLDGGTLDLGVVRDSTLNGTNDYKIFLETFEGVAKVGIESLRVSSALKIWGAAAATVVTTSA
jgi:hypothetical protein